MGKIVTYHLDLENPAPLTSEERAELEALGRPDHEIDTSDIPELTEEFWQRAKRNPYYKPVKQQLTLRLDSDLVAWFKRRAEGQRGYQTDINRVLREYVEAQESKRAG